MSMLTFGFLSGRAALCFRSSELLLEILRVVLRERLQDVLSHQGCETVCSLVQQSDVYWRLVGEPLW